MEQGKPLMSVIVPVYNVENYLERCLDSILAQTYGNWNTQRRGPPSPSGRRFRRH